MHGLIFGGMVSQYKGTEPSIRRSSGAHKIASFLREHNYNIEVIDYIHAWSFEQLKILVEDRITKDTLFFGFSSTFPIATPELLKLVDYLKEQYPDIPTVAGSQNISMKELNCEWQIFGYGEYAILELLRHFQGGPEPVNVNKTIDAYHNYQAYPKADLTVRYEERDNITEREVLLLEFSRGCKFKCGFCSFPVLGVKEDHTRSANNLYDELLENYDKWGTESYIVLDETFNDTSGKIEKYANVMKRLPFEPKLTGYIRADLIASRKKDWDNLISMGFCSHFYGIESFNNSSARTIGKGMNTGRLQDGLLEVKEYFTEQAGYYKGHLSLIAGLPYETIDSLRETKRWIDNYWQGNPFQMTVLMIKDLNIFAPDLSHFSKLDKSWKEYGYKQVPFDPENKGIDTGDYPWYQQLYDLYKTGMYLSWDNGNMTTYEALKWLTEEFPHTQYIDPFAVDNYYIDPEVTWKDIAIKSFMEIGPRRKELIEQHIEKYKQKKLIQLDN